LNILNMKKFRDVQIILKNCVLSGFEWYVDYHMKTHTKSLLKIININF